MHCHNNLMYYVKIYKMEIIKSVSWEKIPTPMVHLLQTRLHYFFPTGLKQLHNFHKILWKFLFLRLHSGMLLKGKKKGWIIPHLSLAASHSQLMRNFIFHGSVQFKKLPLKNCLPFSYFKVYQWQYNEAMQFVLWVAQKIDLQA